MESTPRLLINLDLTQLGNYLFLFFEVYSQRAVTATPNWYITKYYFFEDYIKRSTDWFQINWKMVNTIWFRFDSIRFRKYFSVCTTECLVHIAKTIWDLFQYPFLWYSISKLIAQLLCILNTLFQYSLLRYSISKLYFVTHTQKGCNHTM